MSEVPFTDLAGRHAAVAPAVEARVLAVLRSGRYVGGPVVAEAEARVAALCGKAHGVGVGSGTDALALGLQALGVGPGDEVIVPAVTFFATAGAVCRVGATPVIADVLPERPLVDPASAAALVGARTRAVVPVHLFGSEAPPLDLGVPVLDDAAQAVGSRPFVGRGALAALSFYPTKLFGAAGQAGMVVTDDPLLAEGVRRLGVHGQAGDHLHDLVAGQVGTNARLDALQAAVLLGHLDLLDDRLARQRALAERYRAALGELVVPFSDNATVSVLCLRHPDRDRLRAALAGRGVQSGVYYPRSLAAQPALAGRLRPDQPPTPEADRFCAEALAIPCHPEISLDQVEQVIAAVRACA